MTPGLGLLGDGVVGDSGDDGVTPGFGLLGAGAVFLEVDEDNVPARKLYRRAGFREVGRRAGYYQDPTGRSTAALVLRRDL